MQKSIRIAYDIIRLSSGGGNGGIKQHVYAFLERLCKLEPEGFHFLILASEDIVDELAFLSDFANVELYLPVSDTGFDPRNSAIPLPTIHYFSKPRSELLHEIKVDLLYAGFGQSEFHQSDIPQISLIVDCLHNDLPEHLPSEEVNYRNEWYPKAIEQAAIIQTNSDHAGQRIQNYYDIEENDIITVYLPLHERFANIEQSEIPSSLAGRPYFLYPANFWSHKNHECLLIAYNEYLRTAEEDCRWDLVLTGQLDNKSSKIEALSISLGINAHVHFLGHLEESTFKAVWGHSSALVYPSLYEGFGLPIVEAMHFQTPITCSDCASLPEIAREASLFFDPRKPEDISRALLRLSSESSLREALIKKGRKILPEFQLDTEAKKLADAIKELVSKDETKSKNNL